MRCIKCDHDSKYKERQSGTCPKCGERFAFEPQRKDAFTDRAFLNAIQRVSSEGHVRWTVRNLYCEACRLKRWRFNWKGTVGAATIAAVLWAVGIWGNFPTGVVWAAIITVTVSVYAVVEFLKLRFPQHTVPLTYTQFRDLFERWRRAHGIPKGFIEAREQESPSRVPPPDIVEYSFDRVVICDEPHTVDLLLANNFHFENNCAVLTANGYPPGPFETVRTMLKRNPRLQVFALHDARPYGCRMAHQVANDPDWFQGQAPVVDVGLRPGHARPFTGLLLPNPHGHILPGAGVTVQEAVWLSQYTLELAAIRPEQVLKRLYRAVNKKSDASTTGGDGGDGAYLHTGSGYVEEDMDSFSSEAGAMDGGDDSFG